MHARLVARLEHLLDQRDLIRILKRRRFLHRRELVGEPVDVVFGVAAVPIVIVVIAIIAATTPPHRDHEDGRKR